MRVVLADDLESLKEQVIGCGIAVHRALGPGLLESIYRDCLSIELRAAGLTVERERCVAIQYRGQVVGAALKVDLVVENRLIVEVKAVERLHPVFSAQVLTYWKLTGFPIGLLMNFNNTTLKAGLKTLVHPDLYETPTVRSDP
jgi:GxxExxY protein